MPYLWRPHGVTDEEVEEEYPLVLRNLMRLPLKSGGIEEAMMRRVARDCPEAPHVAAMAQRMLRHVEAHEAAQALQARVRCAARRLAQRTWVLAALHPRLGAQSPLGCMLDENLLRMILLEGSLTI